MTSLEKFTILYGRLSQEDSQKGNRQDDSNSIQNQRLLLEKYAAPSQQQIRRAEQNKREEKEQNAVVRPNFAQALLARNAVADKIGRDERVDNGVLQARFEHTNVLVHRLEKEVDEQPHTDRRVAVAGQHPEKDHDRGKEQQRHHHRNGKQQLVVVGHADRNERPHLIGLDKRLVAHQNNHRKHRNRAVDNKRQQL